jgi:hypothetical protein
LFAPPIPGVVGCPAVVDGTPGMIPIPLFVVVTVAGGRPAVGDPDVRTFVAPGRVGAVESHCFASFVAPAGDVPFAVRRRSTCAMMFFSVQPRLTQSAIITRTWAIVSGDG